MREQILPQHLRLVPPCLRALRGPLATTLSSYPEKALLLEPYVSLMEVSLREGVVPSKTVVVGVAVEAERRTRGAGVEARKETEGMECKKDVAAEAESTEVELFGGWV